MSVGSARSPEERAAILAQQGEGVQFGGGGLSFLKGPKSRRDNSAPVIDANAPPAARVQEPDVVQAQPQGDGRDQGSRSWGGLATGRDSNRSRGGSLSGPRGGGGGRGGGGTAAGAEGAGSPF